MTRNRIISQAIAGGLIYFVISLILERNTAPEVLAREGVEALIFGAVYGVGLWVYHKYLRRER